MFNNIKDFRFSSLPWLWYGLAVVICVVDVVTKRMITNNFALFEVKNIMPFFDLTLRHNHGAAFSFLHDQEGWQRWFFTIVASVMSLVLIVWLARLKKNNIYELCAIALILGGALGNLYDRATLGYVIDFLLVYYKEHQWPAFNVADSAICVGAGLLILHTFKGSSNEDSSTKDSSGKDSSSKNSSIKD